MGGADLSHFTFAERLEFQRAFEAISTTLPKMFRPFMQLLTPSCRAVASHQ